MRFSYAGWLASFVDVPANSDQRERRIVLEAKLNWAMDRLKAASFWERRGWKEVVESVMYDLEETRRHQAIARLIELADEPSIDRSELADVIEMLDW